LPDVCYEGTICYIVQRLAFTYWMAYNYALNKPIN